MKKRSKDGADEVKADLLPVMNIMFLLIPALLVAMEFASMASVVVTPPNMCSGCTTKNTPPAEPLHFQVEIREDGFKATAGGAMLGELIPLQNGAHDFAALAERTRTLKHSHPDEARVTVTAEPRVHMQTLVQTLDTLRGDECRLAGVARGEAPSAQCLFWEASISSFG
ncbi:MAG: biopolymer transporter ExbD [Nannocystis sp.]|nr:biopolymer transporter ExbD [Nannocystis sp.]MBA3549614.1 biopolymer transporter ExbD [Nannocystis sp.]